MTFFFLQIARQSPACIKKQKATIYMLNAQYSSHREIIILKKGNNKRTDKKLVEDRVEAKGDEEEGRNKREIARNIKTSESLLAWVALGWDWST